LTVGSTGELEEVVGHYRDTPTDFNNANIYWANDIINKKIIKPCNIIRNNQMLNIKDY